MKFVKLSQEELQKIATFYKEVMSTAYEGLFFREGKVIGEGIMQVVQPEDDFKVKAAKLIKARGWVEEIELGQSEAKAKGCIEVKENSNSQTCHRLRGMLAIIYEEGTGNIVEVKEKKCESIGDEECVFEISVKF
ncbi:MAG: V4R domain-containing protein [Candidatus Saliniplasma sp.]